MPLVHDKISQVSARLFLCGLCHLCSYKVRQSHAQKLHMQSLALTSTTLLTNLSSKKFILLPNLRVKLLKKRRVDIAYATF